MAKRKNKASPMYWKMAIGRSREMKRWRKRQGLSQIDFARALDMSRRAIQYIETLKRGCQIGTYRRFESLKKRYEEAA